MVCMHHSKHSCVWMFQIFCKHSNDADTWYINCMQELQLRLWSEHVCIHTDYCVNKQGKIHSTWTASSSEQYNTMCYTGLHTIWYLHLNGILLEWLFKLLTKRTKNTWSVIFISFSFQIALCEICFETNRKTLSAMPLSPIALTTSGPTSSHTLLCLMTNYAPIAISDTNIQFPKVLGCIQMCELPMNWI